MSVTARPVWLRYGMAIGAVIVGLWVMRLPVIGHALGAALFFAVLVSAWFGGIGPGILATAFPAALLLLFVAASKRPITLQQAVGLCVFVAGGLLITALVEAMHSARRRAEESMADAQRHQEQLREADQRKDEFLAMLAHELRNPLAAVSGAVQLLQRRNWPGRDDEECAWSLEVLERQSGHLARLIDDLLDVSRVSRGKVQLLRERLDACVVLRRAVEVVRVAAEAHGHVLRMALSPEPLWVDADPTRLEQILVNLLANAIKYTEPGGRIDVSAERDRAECVLRVRDTGVGIAPEVLPHIFDLFIQADKTLDRAQGGLGIGLTLVRRLVELHGGRVSASSAGLGQGSEFRVRLLLAETPLEAPVRPLSLPQTVPGRPLRILVVDDSVDTAVSLARLLQHSGHEVRTAHDGRTALDLARVEPPNVALIDIGLPGMNGYELAEHLRDQSASMTTLIAISGYAHEQDIRRSREAGIAHHLVKPINIDTLLEMLATLHSERETGLRRLASPAWREQRV